MKKGLSIAGILCVVLAVVSCSDTPSYTDRLNDERKAINRLMDENDFVVIKDYPKNGAFKDNEFYKMENDVYINVVDTGNGSRAVSGATVYCRFSVNFFFLDSAKYTTHVSNYGPHSNGTSPVEFRYGSYAAIIQDGGTNGLESLMSEGLQSGLQYVGDRGKVKLIVPFKVGSQEDNSNFHPVFFEMVEYKLKDNL
ncbi:hypothetical protein Barb6_02539 [Bacteroidales bacterium Barb6]|nr:hypothetical protein Barb6_02539 [Bacteroidales bacterium Barb6]